MGWDGEGDGGGSGKGTHVHPWLIHVNVWQKPLQYCKVITLQLKKKKKLWQITVFCYHSTPYGIILFSITWYENVHLYDEFLKSLISHIYIKSTKPNISV